MQLCRSLAKACAPEVRVNAVAAGVMETEWSQGFSPAKFEQAKKKAALNKISDVEDVAKTYVDLLENGSMTVSVAWWVRRARRGETSAVCRRSDVQSGCGKMVQMKSRAQDRRCQRTTRPRSLPGKRPNADDHRARSSRCRAASDWRKRRERDCADSRQSPSAGTVSLNLNMNAT